MFMRRGESAAESLTFANVDEAMRRQLVRTRSDASCGERKEQRTLFRWKIGDFVRGATTKRQTISAFCGKQIIKKDRVFNSWSWLLKMSRSRSPSDSDFPKD
uniref:Uncharacterized protein n=1 Tax=Steinernema glaseri TaxID=37863 RepID=A0A1I8AF48_9BILA